MGQGLVRREDWQGRLNTEILKAANRPFRYGRHDCCVSAARCVRVMTGFDPMTIFGAYSKWDHDVLLRKYRGLKGFVKAVGLEKIPVTRATGGDIAIVRDMDDLHALGIVALNGKDVFVVKRPRGWGTVPLRDAQAAYRVP